MQDAILDAANQRPIIRLERLVGADPRTLWRALTDRRELEAWFPTDIITDEWRVGAELRFVFRGGEWHDLSGTVLEYDEPRVLAFTWGEETLRFELTEVEGGTRLVLTDELDARSAARNAAGWDVCLELLQGHATEDGLWKTRFDHYLEAFVPAIGPQDGPPARD